MRYGIVYNKIAYNLKISKGIQCILVIMPICVQLTGCRTVNGSSIAVSESASIYQQETMFSVNSEEMSFATESQEESETETDSRKKVEVCYSEEQKLRLWIHYNDGYSIETETLFTMEDVYGLLYERKRLYDELNTGTAIEKGMEIEADGEIMYKQADKDSWSEYEEWALKIYTEDYVYNVFTPEWFEMSGYYCERDGGLYRAAVDGITPYFIEESVVVNYRKTDNTYFITAAYDTIGGAGNGGHMYYIYQAVYDEDSEYKLKIMEEIKLIDSIVITY